MNIFVLDRNVKKCAQYHCDQHVVKMILESAQMLCTSLSKRGYKTPYRPTHHNHPCVLWVDASFDNFLWLKALALELNNEFKFRFEKETDHASALVIQELKGMTYRRRGLTPFVQAMPEKYRFAGNPVRAYRAFYNGDKSRFARWTKRPAPPWFLVNTQVPG